jgi:large conductance mechanosensitive channel
MSPDASSTGSGEGTGMRDLVDGLKAFIFRGNAINFAVAVVIGAALTQLVNSMVENMVTPIGGQPDFSYLTFTPNISVFRYGAFINSTISFLIIALVVYFLLVKAKKMLVARATPEAADAELGVCSSAW